MTSKIEDETMTSGTYEFTSHDNIVDLEKKLLKSLLTSDTFFSPDVVFFFRERASFEMKNTHATTI